MSSIKYQCIYCLFPYQVTLDDLGGKVVCQNCGKKNIVPNDLFGTGRIIASDFRIDELLGVGGMGSVYSVTQFSFNRQIALKILLERFSKDEKYRKAFIKEANSVASLHHVNLTSIYAFGESDDGSLYLGLEYVKGKTLAYYLEGGKYLSIRNSLKVLSQLSKGLGYAWQERKIVHRDIKPENIIINADGVLKLTDMGLARQASELVDLQEVSGTPSYISPEQLLKKSVDFRSDMYALGIVLYQCVTGKLPFFSKSIKTLAKMHLKDLVQFDKSQKIPTIVRDLIFRLTAKQPKQRFGSYDDLQSFIHEIQKKHGFEDDIFNDHFDFGDTAGDEKNLKTHLKRRLTKSIEDQHKEKQLVSERHKGIILLVSVFSVALLVFIFTSAFFREAGISVKVDKLLAKVEQKQIKAEQVLEKIDSLGSEFNYDTRSVIQWQAYSRLVDLKLDYLKQLIDYLQNDNEFLKAQNKIIQFEQEKTQRKIDYLKKFQSKEINNKSQINLSLDEFSHSTFDNLSVIWRQQKSLYFSLISDNLVDKKKIIDMIDSQLPLLNDSFREELLFFRKIVTAYQETLNYFLTGHQLERFYGINLLGGKVTSIGDNKVNIFYPSGQIKEYSLVDKKVLVALIQTIIPRVFRKNTVELLDFFLLSQYQFNSIKNRTKQTNMFLRSYIDYAVSNVDLYNLKNKPNKASLVAKQIYLQICHTPLKYYFINKIKQSFQYYKVSILPLKDRLIIRLYEKKSV